MLFHSLVFLLAFLPLTLGAHYLLGERYETRIWALIIASLGFYGYWDLRFLPLLPAASGRALSPRPSAATRVQSCHPLPGMQAALGEPGRLGPEQPDSGLHDSFEDHQPQRERL